MFAAFLLLAIFAGAIAVYGVVYSNKIDQLRSDSSKPEAAIWE